jgi:hypothetical protein
LRVSLMGWMERATMATVRHDVFVSHGANDGMQQEVHNVQGLYMRLSSERVAMFRKLHSQDERLRALEDKLRLPPT